MCTFHFLIIFLIILIIFTFVNIYIPKYRIFEKFESNRNNICCFYAYYEKNDLYKSNLEYFLKNAILDDVDYYIIINGNKNGISDFSII